MEFKIINPTEDSGFLQAIEFNFDELKSELIQRLEKYQNLTYTEETVKEAKSDKASLNKFKESIETRRKDIKKLCLKPYEEFEKKVKELTGLIDEPILAIDTQLKDFEDARKTAKEQDIKDFYESVIDDLKDLLPLKKIFNEKWLNSTYKMTTIQNEIIEITGKVSSELKVIAEIGLEPDIELQVKDKYLATLDFGLAMAEKTRLEDLKTAFKERENIQEVEIHQEDIKTNEETSSDLEKVEEQEQEKIYLRKFWVKGTKDQLIKLGEYLKENNIIYGGIQ